MKHLITFGSNDGYEFTEKGCIENASCLNKIGSGIPISKNHFIIVDRLLRTDCSQLQIFDIIKFLHKASLSKPLKILLPKFSLTLNNEIEIQDKFLTKLNAEIVFLG